jgi:hypothetical protein
MNMTTEYISGAEANRMIRARLKQAFPGVKFSVRKTAGGSTNVRWTDGPTRRMVGAVTAEFTGETFDGMTDMREPVSQWYACEDGSVRDIHYMTGLMIEERRMSPEAEAEIARELYGQGYDPNEWDGGCYACDRVWRKFSETDYTGSGDNG